MNLITDELKEHYHEQDMHEVKDLVECVERMYHMWELNIALGKLEDATQISTTCVRAWMI